MYISVQYVVSPIYYWPARYNYLYYRETWKTDRPDLLQSNQKGANKTAQS